MSNTQIEWNKILNEVINKLAKELEKRSNDTAENWINGAYYEVIIGEINEK